MIRIKKKLSNITLKKLLGLSLISFGILFLNYSSSNYQIFPIGIDRYQSERNSQYGISVLKHSRFLSDYLGTTKNILALDNQKLIFRTPQGGLYLFYYIGSELTVVQGYFHYIQSCDVINLSSSGDYIQNCGSAFAVGLNDEIVNNFINTLTNGDYVYVYDDLAWNGCGGYCSYQRLSVKVCFSSNSVGSTMCFVGDKSSYEDSNYGSNRPFYLSQSLNSDTTFGSISRTNLSEPPGFTFGGSSDESSEVEINWNDNNHSEYTNSTIYEGFLRLGYYEGLCYSDFGINDLGVSVDSSELNGSNDYSIFNQFFMFDMEDGQYFTGASVFDLKNYYRSNFQNRLRFTNVYNIRKSSNQRYNIDWYVGKPKGFWRLMYKLHNAVEGEVVDFDPDDYFTFCDMTINGFEGSDYYTGAMSNDITQYFQNNTNYVLSGAGSFSGQKDYFNLFNNFYTRFKSAFQPTGNVTTGSGILPNYIIFAFFLFLLLYGLRR